MLLRVFRTWGAGKLEKYRKTFDDMDEDGGGSLDTQELGVLLKTIGLEMTKDEVIDMAKQVDEDGSGDMDFDEFLEVIMIATVMKEDKIPREEVMLKGDPDSPFFLEENQGEGRAVGREMAEVAVRTLFHGLADARMEAYNAMGHQIRAFAESLEGQGA